MSTLQVANIYFDSSGTKKIVFSNNDTAFVINDVTALNQNTTNSAIYNSSVPAETGSYKLSYNSTAPYNYVSVTNNTLNVADYPTLGTLLNSNPWKDTKEGTGWLNSTTANTNNMNAVAYGNGVFVAVGSGGSIQSSTDGITWTNRTTANTNAMNAIAYGNGTFVAVGASGAVQTSTDGTTWTNRTTATLGQSQFGIAYFSNSTTSYFISVGNAGTLQYSTSGSTWTNSVTANTNALHSIVIVGNQTLAVGNNGSIQTGNPPTVSTSRGPTAGGDALYSVTFGNGVYVAVGNNGYIKQSINTTSAFGAVGAGWVNSTSANTNTLRAISYGNGMYVAVGGNGVIQTSTDGLSWVQRTEANTQNQNGLVYSGSKFVSVGNSGSIQVSNSYVSYDTATKFKTPPYLYSFSPFQNSANQTQYIYMKT